MFGRKSVVGFYALFGGVWRILESEEPRVFRSVWFVVFDAEEDRILPNGNIASPDF